MKKKKNTADVKSRKMSRCLCLLLVLCGYAFLQLLFVSALQGLPLEAAGTARPHVWQEKDDSFNTSGHDTALVQLLRAMIPDLREPVPAQRGWKSQRVNSYTPCIYIYTVHHQVAHRQRDTAKTSPQATSLN